MLKDEIRAGESRSLEFKRIPNEDREKYLKTVVAFANGRGGRIIDRRSAEIAARTFSKIPRGKVTYDT